MHADVVAAARALLAVPRGDRAALAARMLAEAEAADRWRRRLRRRHPLWGDGTLAAVAAGRRQAPEPWLGDAEYCDCMLHVFEALLGRHGPRR